MDIATPIDQALDNGWEVRALWTVSNFDRYKTMKTKLWESRHAYQCFLPIWENLRDIAKKFNVSQKPLDDFDRELLAAIGEEPDATSYCDKNVLKDIKRNLSKAQTSWVDLKGFWISLEVELPFLQFDDSGLRREFSKMEVSVSL